uniref:ANAPC4_WD40 domain-containing protein n=1 Tax=Caenorhabditis tropicalis TaxID=1561998 RepID=A0A1I7UQR8_9PELO
MCFSPHNDLIALGSKNGDVMLKRTTWKMIWKTNVSMVPAVGTECKSDSSVSAMHFSPDGRFIAAATSKGIIHLLDVETGKVRYSVKAASENITKLQWEATRDSPIADKLGEFRTDTKNNEALEAALEMARNAPDCSAEEIGFVYQRLDEDGSSFKHDETQRENLERTLISSYSYCESLRNTILLAIDSNPKIIVLIAGVLPFMEIDVNETLEQVGHGMVLWYDSAHYSSAFNGVSFIATTYGPFLDCKQKVFKAPGNDPNRTGQGVQTLLFNVKLELDPSLWEAAFRYIRLLYAFNMYNISLDTTKRNWDTQVDNLHALFDTKTKAVKIGDVLLEMLLSGATDAAGEGFLERGFGIDGLESLKNFASKHMPEVCRLARGQLASAARNLAFQKCEFISSLERYERIMEMDNDDSFLYRDISETYFNNRNKYLNSLDNDVGILEAKTRHVGLQCLTMMKELSHLAKWISLTKPFAKTMKVNALMKIKRMEINKVLRYIVRNFIPDKEVAEKIEKRLFGLKELIKEQMMKDFEEDFNEEEYLDRLEKLSDEERKKIVDSYHVKFKFDALSDENDAVALKLDMDKDNSETNLESMDATTSSGDGDQQPPCDLDRVGSFFREELSEKALEVYPVCDERYGETLDDRGKQMKSEEVRKMGFVRVLDNLAKTLCSPHRVNYDSTGKNKKAELTFVHELNSESSHQGFTDVQISDVTPSFFKSHGFNKIPGMGISIQVSTIGKKVLNSVVIVPKDDNEKEAETEINQHVEAMKRFYSFETIDITVNTEENQPPPVQDEPMKVDENELRINHPEYNTLTEYTQILPLRHGELVVIGKLKSSQEGGVLSRMMRSVSSYPHQHSDLKDLFAVNISIDGKSDVSIDRIIVHPTTELVAFLHDEKLNTPEQTQF